MAAKSWNSSTGDWATPGDWTPTGVPSGDDVSITQGTPDVTTVVPVIASVTLGTGNTDPGLFIDGGTLQTTGDLTTVLGQNVGVQIAENGTGAGTSSLMVGGTLRNASSITAGFTGTIPTAVSITAGAIVNTGGITLTAKGTGTATLNVSGTTNNQGIIQIDGGRATMTGAVTGFGQFSFDAQGSNKSSFLEFGGVSDNNVAFEAAFGTNSPPSTLKLDAPAGYTGSIGSFGSGDVLDLANETATIQSYDGSTLKVATGTGTQTFRLSGPAANRLQAISDGNGGTDIVVVCFASGTAIRTRRGDVAVEDLVVGDIARTASGADRRIEWIGHRRIDCRVHAAPRTVHPIRIAAHAFGAGRPVRDLFVSPGHAICVDILGEVLVPAGLLVNGSTIVQVEVDHVTYWHVELGSHDLLLAEGLPAESYFDMGNRRFFAEADIVDLHASPDAPVRTHGAFCRPYVDRGAVLDAVRDRLRSFAVRASGTMSEAASR